jgi:hypothetical protein
MYPTSLIRNYVSGRWHPILFRPAPLPSGADIDSGCLRYRSKGHHTEGFATKDEAVAWIKDHSDTMTFLEGVEFCWDGNGVPTVTTWIPNKHET